MSNDVSNFIPELWSARHQKLREAMLVAKPVSNFEEQAGLKFGDRVHRPIGPDFVVDDYTRNTDTTPQDVTTSDQYMDINRQKVVAWDLDAMDIKQSKYDIEAESFDRATYQIKNEMDSYRLRETLNASYTGDAGNAGGSAGTPVTLTPAVCVQFFENCKAVMRTNRVETDRPWYAIVSPKVRSVIAQTFVGDGFQLADSTLKNGYMGDAFGLKIYESTNLVHTQTATLSTVVNGNTITIAGVTFTFATTATTAGDVDLGADDTAAAANFVLAFNGTGTPGATTYIALSAANRKIIKGLNAIASSALGVITIQTAGEVVYSRVGSPITLGTQVANCEIGRMGAVDMVVQMDVEVQKNKLPRQSGWAYQVYDLYGVKTFTEGAVRMLNAKVVA